MSDRFTSEVVEAWRTDGAILLPSFFSPGEMVRMVQDFDALFAHARPKRGMPVNLQASAHVDNLPPEQFQLMLSMPFACSPALNLLALHPALIAFAKAALGVPDVRLYQNLAWAKFTGATDFEQPFHMDYLDHTLLTPGDAPQEKTLNISIYASDVTDAHGAIRYVTRPEGDAICGKLRPYSVGAEHQQALRKVQRSGAGPCGSIFAYSSDVYHRATNLTIENGHRYTLFIGYKSAHNTAVDFSAWPTTAGHKKGDRLWAPIFGCATPEQLACLNVPPPGDPFWTEPSLARTQHRWPDWNLAPWWEALS